MNRDQLLAIRARLAQSRARSTPPAAPSSSGSARAVQAPPEQASDFRHLVGQVSPMRSPPRVPSAAPKPSPEPLQRQRDERAVLREALSDDFDVETLLDTDGELSFHRPQVGADVPRKLRRGAWVSQAEIDLHGLTRDQARDALSHFLAEAVRRGLRCVRVVHGKGSGSPGRVPVLKHKVRAWLVQHERVMAFVQAPRALGGHGAVIVLLAA